MSSRSLLGLLNVCLTLNPQFSSWQLEMCAKYCRYWLYTLCSCLFLGAIFDLLAAAAALLLDMPVASTFNRPWLVRGAKDSNSTKKKWTDVEHSISVHLVHLMAFHSPDPQYMRFYYFMHATRSAVAELLLCRVLGKQMELNNNVNYAGYDIRANHARYAVISRQGENRK